MIKASDQSVKSTEPQATLSTSEILGNSFIFLFAGHDTTASLLHFSLIQVALHPFTQRALQSSISIIVSDKPTSQWSYDTDMPSLFNSMVGAVLHETLRLIPAVSNIPKFAAGDQEVVVDGRKGIVPGGAQVYMNIVGVHRNPRYWDEPEVFNPGRWLISSKIPSLIPKNETEIQDINEDTPSTASFESKSGSTSLLVPEKGTFIPFSLGSRSCPGKKFAQVESVAVLATILQKYSVELDVSEWASDEEVASMGRNEKKSVYIRAVKRAEEVLKMLEQTITLKMRKGDTVPLRFVERGAERFAECF
jgi:cytochrome P450